MNFYALCRMSAVELDRRARILRGDVASKINRRDNLLKANTNIRAINRLTRQINAINNELQQIDLLIGDKLDAEAKRRQAAGKYYREERL